MLTETEPHYRQPLLKTPFHERGRALSQLDSFVPWAGYTTVDVFTSVEQEYFAIRNASSLYDLTPMVKYRIAGPDALRFLNRLVTRDIRKVAPGKVAYTVWCNDEGQLIDDGTVFCLAPDEYRLCTAERQLDWFRASAIGFDVEIREVTEEVAALAVQGPTSAKLLKAVGLAGVERLKPFEHAGLSMARTGGAGRIAMMVSRTGFTGDLGYELWMQPTDAEAVWDALMAVGSSRAVRPIGSARPQHGAHRGGFRAAEPRLRLRGAHPVPGHRALAARARTCLAGGFQQGTLHRPPRAAGRAGTRPATAAGGTGRRGHQAGAQRAPVSRSFRENRGGQRDLGDVVANLQAQPGARHGATPLTSPRAPPSGPRSTSIASWCGSGAWCARGWWSGHSSHRRGDARRRRRTSEGAAVIANPSKQPTDRPWLDPQRHAADRDRRRQQDLSARTTAVDNVTLSIYKGEMFALVGASGCGKTTLLRMLAGFAQPSSGRIRIDGVDMSTVPPHQRPVNMMFQSYALFPHMTVERNVGYGLRRLPLDEATRRRRVAGGARHGAARRARPRKPHQLSGGQRQRVALARALIRRPKVLLLDEPLSALDKKLREQTQFELMDLQYKVGITFIVVTHDQDEAMALATRIAVMDRGQVVQVGTPAEIYEFPAQPLRGGLRRHHQPVRGHGRAAASRA